MKSLDTNILLYAVNSDCREHRSAKDLVDAALAEPEGWIVAEQVWFELYRLLRNPVVLERPLRAAEAAEVVSWYRERSGWLHCAWEPSMMPGLGARWRDPAFPARRTFDLVLAGTLLAHGVDRFWTRNVKDFEGLGFRELVDPIGVAPAS